MLLLNHGKYHLYFTTKQMKPQSLHHKMCYEPTWLHQVLGQTPCISYIDRNGGNPKFISQMCDEPWLYKIYHGFVDSSIFVKIVFVMFTIIRHQCNMCHITSHPSVSFAIGKDISYCGDMLPSEWLHFAIWLGRCSTLYGIMSWILYIIHRCGAYDTSSMSPQQLVLLRSQVVPCLTSDNKLALVTWPMTCQEGVRVRSGQPSNQHKTLIQNALSLPKIFAHTPEEQYTLVTIKKNSSATTHMKELCEKTLCQSCQISR